MLRSVGCAVTTCVPVLESYLGLLAARSSSQLGFFGCVLAEDRADCAIVLGPITGAAAQYPYPLRSHIVGKSDDVIDAIAWRLDVIGFSAPQRKNEHINAEGFVQLPFSNSQSNL